MVYPNTLPILFVNVKLVTILEMEINLLLVEDYKNLFFPYPAEAWNSLDSTIVKYNNH